MMAARPVITLLSDFGLADGYVATMKGVILGIAPDATLVDISHDMAPQDVRQGALTLAQAAPWFPQGTVHLAVVDPGVGSARVPIVVETPTARFVGPNNGLLTLAARPPRAVHEAQGRAFRLAEVSATFHGRDVFAPAAAFLARGTPVAAMGPPLEDGRVVDLDVPGPRREGDAVVGEVLQVDHFGNLITNLGAADVQDGRAAWLEVGAGTRVALGRAYADVGPGEALAVVGSGGFVEIAVRDGSAASALGLGRGACVRVRGGRP